MKGKPWAVYTRVSTDGQAQEGVSLEVQRLACVDLLRLLGHPMGEHFEDAGHSAKNLQRPAAARMLALADAAELGGVIVYKLDRLTRSVSDLFDLLARFDAAGVALVSVREQIDTSTAMGRFFVGLIGLIAQWEREQISERVTAAMRHRKAQGGFTGGRPPAGLLAEGKPGARLLVVDPVHGAVVAEAWAKVAAGASLRQVAAGFTAGGLPTTSKHWTIKGAHNILRNERYVGLLVDRATFDAAGDALSGRLAPGKTVGRKQATASQTHAIRTWPLSGLARCGKCDSSLIGVHATNGRGNKFPYLRCSGRVRKGPKFCSQKDIPAEPWEALVMRALAEAIAKPKELLTALAQLRREVSAAAAPLEAQRIAKTLERDATVQRVRNLAEVASAGGAVARGLAVPIAEAQGAVEALDAELARIDSKLAACGISGLGADAMVASLRRDLSGLEDAPPEEQASTLQGVLAKVVLHVPESPKEAGQVDLSINLPPMPTEFVRSCTVVDRSTRRTNAILPVSRREVVPSLREWRAGLAPLGL